MPAADAPITNSCSPEFPSRSSIRGTGPTVEDYKLNVLSFRREAPPVTYHYPPGLDEDSVEDPARSAASRDRAPTWPRRPTGLTNGGSSR